MMRATTAPWADWREVKITPSTAKPGGYIVEGFDPRTNARYSRDVARAAQQCFGIERECAPGLGPAGRISKRNRLRLAYREIVVRFEPKVGETLRAGILGRLGFRVGEPSPYADKKNQWIATNDGSEFVGQGLYAAAERLASLPEVVFAWPNLASEYRREAAVAPLNKRWWLETINVIGADGKRRPDVPEGDPSIVIAIIDDGVDLLHPNLKNRASNLGRDFTKAKSSPQFLDANPKTEPTDDDDEDNRDFHGTACAGVAVSDGTAGQMFGVAPACKFMSVRALNGSAPVKDATAAAAIRYATAQGADIILCAWTADDHEDIKRAIDEAADGRDGKGVAVFCAAGSQDGQVGIGYPAALENTIAVGACTNTGQVDGIGGPELDVVAPSQRGDSNIFTTDIRAARGRNPGGTDQLGDQAGDFWNNFGGTSVATAMAAGVGALCLSVNPKLTSDELRDVLQETAANKIGTHKIAVPSDGFGSGVIDAAAAVAEAGRRI